MNILFKKNTNEIKHQNAEYVLKNNCVEVFQNDELLYVLCDLNSDNAEVGMISTAIENFTGNKYLFVNDEVVLNSNYKEPTKKLTPREIYGR